MLAESADRIASMLQEDDLVLDVGGGWDPFPRADHVLDLLPYRHVDGARYSESTWVQRDMCDKTPWPYADDQFDFAVCSHTLEDVRDPVWVCAELSRVARAGYVEVPSRLTEQTVGVQGPWVGYGHHHWLVDLLEDATLQFVFKSHVLDAVERFQVPPSVYRSASDEDRVLRLFWEGGVQARERIFIGPDEHDVYMAEVVSRLSPRRRLRSRLRG